jgi:V/A-type H+/Na+-transporting ATPase subunit E
VNQVQELEQAILARAERLAAELRERANRSRDSILREAGERLRLREAREESIAKSLGERTFRQKVQASELKMQSQLDRLRWNLVQDVERRLEDRMRAFMQDESAYSAWLMAAIGASAAQIERHRLRISANAHDHQRVFAHWDRVCALLPEGREAALVDLPIDTLAGVLVESEDGLIRVDNTFEGRLERLRPRVQQTILERLLPGGFETGNLFTG